MVQVHVAEQRVLPLDPPPPESDSLGIFNCAQLSYSISHFTSIGLCNRVIVRMRPGTESKSLFLMDNLWTGNVILLKRRIIIRIVRVERQSKCKLNSRSSILVCCVYRSLFLSFVYHLSGKLFCFIFGICFRVLKKNNIFMIFQIQLKQIHHGRRRLHFGGIR